MSLFLSLSLQKLYSNTQMKRHSIKQQIYRILLYLPVERQRMAVQCRVVCMRAKEMIFVVVVVICFEKVEIERDRKSERVLDDGINVSGWK